MRLIQYLDVNGTARVGRVSDDGRVVSVVGGFSSMYELALAALGSGLTLDATVGRARVEAEEPYVPLLASGRMLPPLTHPDPAHCLVSGTGLTHLGSAATRDAMHLKSTQKAQDEAQLTDSMRMFRWGIEGGRPTGNQPGAQPEWFYKGNGSIVVACGQPIVAPDFALDFGEEPEVVGLYVIGLNGQPVRLGYAIGNEFSDHVTERRNYLYLAHSKLRQCGVGPELRTGPLPDQLEGMSRVRRDGVVRWEKPFLTGETNMCHSLANLEYHHFKYAAHRLPGDVHLHFFGTATLSFADGIRVEPGEQFEIDLPAMGAPLVNPLAVVAGGFRLGGVRAL